MTALAAEEDRDIVRQGTAAELKSFGAIVYQKGSDTIKIDSKDLYMLADQIDQVKRNVTEQLAAMNTYFTAGEGEITLNTNADISVVHAQPFETDAVDPLGVNFDTLLEGIAVSQSVSSDVTAYGYPAGTELYKKKDGSLTTDGSGAGTSKITVEAATADDLSAGTAAWVDGNLVLGTGGDTKSGYNAGYNEGYNEGKKAGETRITHKVRIDGDDKHGFDLYIGSHKHFMIVGTKEFSCSPSPKVLYSDYNFVMFDIDASSTGGLVHFQQLENGYGIPINMYYLD